MNGSSLHDEPERWLTPVLLAIAFLAIATPALLVRLSPAPPRAAHAAPTLPPRHIVPQAELPPVEPMALTDLTPDDARTFNQAQPFAIGPIPPARPFRFAGGADDLTRATDCLATAQIYEAGDDATGQRAVAQVVLNRVRHPAFPKSVCGVVFQGSERRTGCQFSFTCDGALARWHPTDATSTRAHLIAAQALAGAVFRPVGLATHYHTDWVVPYWQSSLDKIARVGPHLFFRWTGWWGTPAAFDRHPDGAEPVIAALAPPTGAVDADLPAPMATTVGASPFQPVASDPDSFLLTLPAGLAPELYPSLAASACGERPRCRLSAWPDRAATPATLPLGPEQIAAMAFSYLRDRPAGLERTLWNCSRFLRPDRGECMKVQAFLPAPSPPNLTSSLIGPADPPGVHRKGMPQPVPSATPSPRP